MLAISSHPVSDKVIKKLQEITLAPAELARNATIFSEVSTGEINFRGMAELRDVFDHIRRALHEPEEEALRDLDHAEEHLRRAAVESIQRASTKLYLSAFKWVNKPRILLKIAFIKAPNRQVEVELLREIEEHIATGRALKSDKGRFMDAFENFKSAADKCHDIIKTYPPKEELNFRLFTIVLGVASFLLAIWALFG